MSEEVLLKGELPKAELRKRLTREARENSTRFADYANIEEDGNQKMSFVEFVNFGYPKPEEELKRQFEAADQDGDRYIQVEEFFTWSLNNSFATYGKKAMDATFSKYDTDKSGSLDYFEIDRVCCDMGFGAVSQRIFSSLDEDNSGSISYVELIDALQAAQRRLAGSPSSPSRSPEAGSRPVKVVAREFGKAPDTSGWSLKSMDAESAQKELRDMLVNSGEIVTNLVKIFDQDAGIDLQIDDMEFDAALRKKLGFMGPKHAVDAIFRNLDSDGGGKIGFDEFFEYVKGFRHQLDKRHRTKVSFRLDLPSGQQTYKVDDIAWDVETLRVLMQQMVERMRINSNVLMKAWDKSRGKFTDNSLDHVEFSSQMNLALCTDDPEWPDLWEAELYPVVLEAYAAIKKMSTHVSNRVDAVALERWMAAPTERPSDQLVLEKTPRMKRQRDKRRTFVPQQEDQKRVNLKARTKQGIAAAAGAATARRAAVTVSEAEQLLPRWKRSHGGLPPLQRWEEDQLITSVRSRAFPSIGSTRVLQRQVILPEVPMTGKRPPPKVGEDATEGLLYTLQHESDLASPRSRGQVVIREPFRSPTRAKKQFSQVVVGVSRAKFEALELRYAELCRMREAPLPAQQPADSSRRQLRAYASKLCEQYNMLAMECLQRDAAWAVELLQRALSAAPKGDTTSLVDTLSNLGVCWMHLGSASSAVRYLRQAVATAAEAEMTVPGSPRGSPRYRGPSLPAVLRIRMLLNLCAALNLLGQHREALKQAEAAVALVSGERFESNVAPSGSQSARLPAIDGAISGGLTTRAPPLEMSHTDRETHRALALHNCCVCHEHLGQLSYAQLTAHAALQAAKVVLPEGDPLLLRLENVTDSMTSAEGQVFC